MTNTAQRLEALRKERGVSQKELAQTLGLPKMSIEKFESGKLTPNKDQLTKLANYFRTTVAYLRCEIDEPGNMGSWLSGDYQDEEKVTASAPTKRTPAPQSKAEVAASSGSASNAIFQSEAFKAVIRQSLLDVLRSPEGQQLLSNAIRKELNKK